MLRYLISSKISNDLWMGEIKKAVRTQAVEKTVPFVLTQVPKNIAADEEEDKRDENISLEASRAQNSTLDPI